MNSVPTVDTDYVTCCVGGPAVQVQGRWRAGDKPGGHGGRGEWGGDATPSLHPLCTGRRPRGAQWGPERGRRTAGGTVHKHTGAGLKKNT